MAVKGGDPNAKQSVQLVKEQLQLGQLLVE